MKSICKTEDCTRCGACEAICPADALVRREDGSGHMLKDPDLCVGCGLCEQVCPVNNPLPKEPVKNCYAAFSTDTRARAESASGGLGFLLAKLVISRGGAAAGTVWDSEHSRAEVRLATSVEEAEDFKGSKYVHSDFLPETYGRIRRLLREGREVFFAGTPCQVAGLRKYLSGRTEGLVCADLICHGTCPEEYLRSELEYLGHPKGKVRFRGNDGQDFRLSIWKDGKCSYSESYLTQPYFWGFLRGTTLRESCLHCSYASPARVGDLTLGDFIGLGKKKPYAHDRKNVSAVLTCTEKGERLLSDLLEAEPGLVCEKRDYSERLEYRPSLSESCKSGPEREIFLSLLPSLGFSESIRRAHRDDLRRGRFTAAWRRAHHLGHLMFKRLGLR